MGDRIVFTVIQDGDKQINLYSHWGGYTRFEDLANALEASRPRWNDDSYATRIIISQLIGDAWNSETGYGIWVGEDLGAGEYHPLIINLTNKTITDETGTHDFDTFINFHRSKVDA